MNPCPKRNSLWLNRVVPQSHVHPQEGEQGRIINRLGRPRPEPVMARHMPQHQVDSFRDAPRRCDMSRKWTEDELRRFYDRWAPSVTTFCQLYIGDSQAAEKVTARAFLNYFRADVRLNLDHIPAVLLSMTLEESDYAGDSGQTDVDSDFEWAILGLPSNERAVFILHGVLDLQLPWVAAVTRTPFSTVHQLWVRALINLRMRIVHDSCSRLFSECGPAPEAASGAHA